MDDVIKENPQNVIKCAVVIVQFCDLISNPETIKDEELQKAMIDKAQSIGWGEKIKSIIHELLSLLSSIRFNP